MRRSKEPRLPTPDPAWDGLLHLRGNRSTVNLYGSDRDITGISSIVLEPTADTIRPEIGVEITYRIVEIRREVIET